MLQDKQIEELISKGVSPQIRLYPDRFEYCTFCRDPFDESNQKKLLNCGHYICSQCLQSAKKCCYPGCNNTTPTIIELGKKQFNSNDNANSTFRFSIQFKNTKTSIPKEVKGSATVDELLDEYMTKTYMSEFGQNRTFVTIGIKCRQYNLVKNKRIIDIQKQFKLLSTNTTNLANPVKLNQRFNGGNPF